MFDYTKAALQKIVNDFKKVTYLLNVTTQILYIAYLVYALCVGAGVFWANVVLAALSVAYFIFFMIMTSGRIYEPKTKLQKLAALIFKRCKQIIKLFTLGVMLYGLYSTTQRVTPVSVVLSALMIVGFVLQIIFEIIFYIVKTRTQLLLDGLKADAEFITKPATKVSNFFKKLSGKEIEQPQEKSKTRIWLDERVQQNKAEQAAQKQAEKAARKQAKIDAKNTTFYDSPTPQTENKTTEQAALLPSQEVLEEIAPALLPESKRKKRFGRKRTPKDNGNER